MNRSRAQPQQVFSQVVTNMVLLLPKLMLSCLIKLPKVTVSSRSLIVYFNDQRLVGFQQLFAGKGPVRVWLSRSTRGQYFSPPATVWRALLRAVEEPRHLSSFIAAMASIIGDLDHAGPNFIGQVGTSGQQ